MSEIRMSENQKCPIARQNFLNKTKFTFQAVVAEWVSMCQSIPLANAQGGGFKSERFPLQCTTYNLILLVLDEFCHLCLCFRSEKICFISGSDWTRPKLFRVAHGDEKPWTCPFSPIYGHVWEVKT